MRKRWKERGISTLISKTCCQSSPLENLCIASMQFDRSKTLVQLKRERFGDPAWDFLPFPSGYYLRNKPVHQLHAVELWILIRQGIGLDYLVLLALERLEVE